MKIEKVEKLVANLHKTEYVIYTRNLKEALNHELVLKKVSRLIEINQNTWLKLYIDINIDFRKKKQKVILKKNPFRLMNKVVFGKNIENLRKPRDIKLFTTEKRWNSLVSEPNYHAAKFFTEYVIATKMKKQKYV